jgi:predicted Rossmann fold nucleotide-binding protein DprA/Smf involved in DNA uptake
MTPLCPIKSMHTLGNDKILKLNKTAFLCSRRYPSSIVPKAYDWAIAQREAGNCVISGFHSQIEKDVFHYLLKGKQPIILVLARGLPKRIDSLLKSFIDNGRLLFLSPFEENVTRVTNSTAQKRNRMMIDISDQLVVAYATPHGGLADILSCAANKTVSYLLEHNNV